MLSYSEYKLREADESPATPSAAGGSMPDPVSGMPPGASAPAGLDSGGMGGLGGMGMGGMGGAPSLGGDMGGPPGGGMGGDQKPTALNLNASNFWDVLEKMFKKSKEDNKKPN